MAAWYQDQVTRGAANKTHRDNQITKIAAQEAKDKVRKDPNR